MHEAVAGEGACIRCAWSTPVPHEDATTAWATRNPGGTPPETLPWHDCLMDVYWPPAILGLLAAIGGALLFRYADPVAHLVFGAAARESSPTGAMAKMSAQVSGCMLCLIGVVATIMAVVAPDAW